MNYEMHYNKLIESRKLLKRSSKKDGIYYEVHHIIPKCLDGSNDKNNLIKLTAKEHYLAHLLLYKMAKDKDEKIKLGFAFSAFFLDENKRKLTAKQYEKIRIIAANITSLTMKGVKKSETHCESLKESWKKRKDSPKFLETKQKMSDSAKARVRNPLSEETKKKISDRLKGKKKSKEHIEKLKERITSEETKKKISDSLKGQKLSEETKRKLSEAGKGRQISEETRQKLKDRWIRWRIENNKDAISD